LRADERIRREAARVDCWSVAVFEARRTELTALATTSAVWSSRQMDRQEEARLRDEHGDLKIGRVILEQT
jgi:hypothetical protein